MIPVLLIPALHAESSGFLETRVHGYLGVDSAPVTVVERFRPEMTHALSDRLVVSTTVELTLSQGRSTDQELEDALTDSGLLDLQGCAFTEDTNPALGISTLSDYASVERLSVDAYLPFADLRLGRQAINWGSAFLVNPTDPFPEVLLTDPWADRSGVNAFRATVPLGEAHQVQAVMGTDDAFQDPRIAARATFNVWNTDFSVVGATEPEAESSLAGLDLRGTLGVGWWVEGVIHVDPNADAPYEEVAAGIDYSFPVLDALVFQVQYYRNGHGSPTFDPAALAATMDGAVDGLVCDGVATPTFSPDPFTPVFFGRDYVMGSAALSVNPEIGASALFIQNLGDGSAMAVPVITATPRGWLEIALAAQIPLSTWGDGGELHPSDEALVYDTGLGSLDFSGLFPKATFIAWSRLSF